MFEWIEAVGRMLGLGATAGVRVSLTLALIGVVSRLDFGNHVTGHFTWMYSWEAIFIFVFLAILESTFDKVPALDRLQDRLIMPWRLAGGAIAGASTIGHGWLGLILGLVVGALSAWIGQRVKHGMRPKSAPSGLATALISLTEDLFAFVGAAVTASISVIGYVVFGSLAWLFVRLSRRRNVKYKGLRVLR
ncbi:MAG: DUF4126 domain-containing protein [Thermoleophilia bacterium]